YHIVRRKCQGKMARCEGAAERWNSGIAEGNTNACTWLDASDRRYCPRLPKTGGSSTPHRTVSASVHECLWISMHGVSKPGGAGPPFPINRRTAPLPSVVRSYRS